MTQIESLLTKWDIHCIIFDLDGTLVDTLDKHIEAFELLFEELQISIPSEAISENMGRTPKDTLRSLLPELTDDEKKLEIYAERKEAILSTLLDVIPVFNGAHDLLKYLTKTKIPLCLASSTPAFNVAKILTSAGISDYFKVIITGEDITIGKPNPEVFLKAANKAKVIPNKCLVIGDSPHDIQAAKNANMKIIAVQTGKHNLQEIGNMDIDLLISTLSDLLEVE